LDELGFYWGGERKSMEERIEELKAFKAKHGHVRVTAKQDKSLHGFCEKMRCTRRGSRTTMALTEVRIKVLDDLGFDWRGKKKSFEERIEELKAFEEKHGNGRVTVKLDKSLYGFCRAMRTARRGKGSAKTLFTEDRIKALDELGFDWEDKS